MQIYIDILSSFFHIFEIEMIPGTTCWELLYPRLRNTGLVPVGYKQIFQNICLFSGPKDKFSRAQSELG